MIKLHRNDPGINFRKFIARYAIQVQLIFIFHLNFTKLPQSLNLNPSNQSLPQPKLINGFQLVLYLLSISEDAWAVVAVGDFKTLLVHERLRTAPFKSFSFGYTRTCGHEYK
ncbi:hypothetical protein CEXT_154171 [Caerostris extrusa]|uniref:Uncharacterized protein n=1 Tax=Caerostris extrusa TaxID=172846 RepID=A0AAV4Y2A6_CAEEX|nr:hypothetical protein CEXT_154171 [Caerostris extrusa]